MVAPVTASTQLSRMSREQIIDRIRSFNPTASLGYLGGFDNGALAQYLDHLMTASTPRSERTAWQRPAGLRAITMVDARD